MVLFQNARDKTSHFHGVQSIFHLMRKQTQTDQLQKTEEVRHPSRSKDYNLKNVTYPLYMIHVPEMYDFKRPIVFAWHLKLHKSLRTKITFFNFKIYQVFGFCPYNASIKSIFHNSSKIFTYCGVISLFTIYPRDFEVSFKLHIGNAWYIKLNTTFDLISANIIENYKLEDNKFYTSVHVYHLKLIMTCIITYKIVVEKYQNIVLYTQLSSYSHAIIYNGPGYLTQKTIAKSNSQLIVINSFQIIVEFVTHCAESRSNLNRDLFFTYSTKINDFNTEELSETRLSTSISFSSKGQGVSSIVLFRSPDHSSVNVTILRYSFQGVYEPNCPFGAVSFFEYSNLQNITEIKSICSSSIEGHFQNVYSSTGSMLIVFYAYREYSSLNVTVNVSYTRCQSVRIQSCILFEICLQHYNLKRTRQSCWKGLQYTLRALEDMRLKTKYPQMHIFGHAPSEGCIILQMTTDPQSSHPQYTHLYIKKRKDYHGCSFYLNFKTNLFNSVTTWWSFRIAGFLSHPSRFHIVREPHTPIHENLYDIDKQGGRSKGVFDYDNCSNNIRNIKPTSGKDMAIDLLHYENSPKNLLYFVYFNMWTKHNINPSWLDIIVTTETNISINSKHLVILDKIPYDFNRVVPSSDQFSVLSFPKLHGNSSLLFMQASTDHTYFSVYKIWRDWEYLVVHWKIIYHLKAKQDRIAIALPGAIHNITAKNLDENNLTMSFKWTALPQRMNVRTQKKCKRKLWDYQVGTTWTGYYEFRVECHSFEMPLNDYYIHKVVPHLRPNVGHKYNILNHHYQNNLLTCVRGSRRMPFKESWIEAVKTCKSKGMALPEFLSRRDQEELLYLLKSTSEDTSIFPVKALFIGCMVPLDRYDAATIQIIHINFKILVSG